MCAQKIAAAPELVIRFELKKEVTGEKTSNQIKATLKELLFTYGAIDEIIVKSMDSGADVNVFFYAPIR